MALDDSHYLLPRIPVIHHDPIDAVYFLQNKFTEGCILWAMLALITYNSAIMIDKEVHHFWGKPISSAAVVFYLTRLCGILNAVCNTIDSNHFTGPECLFVQWGGTLSSSMIVILFDYILLLRVKALYSNHKRICFALQCIFVADAIIIIVSTSISNVAAEFVLGDFGPELTLCGEHSGNLYASLLIWFAPLAYGLLLMCMALYEARRIYKEVHGLTGMSLVKVLVFDQALYFMTMIFCTACTVAGDLAGLSTVASAIIYACGDPIILAVLGQHMLINLREAVERGQNPGTNYSLNISAIDFGDLHVTPGMDNKTKNENETNTSTTSTTFSMTV